MKSTDYINFLIIAIITGYKKKKKFVSFNFNKITIQILKILVLEGLIIQFSILNNDIALIKLKYYKNQPIIKNMIRISTPGNKIFLNYKNLNKNLNTFFNKNNNLNKNLNIISTNKGIITNRDTLLYNIGGEILLSIEY